MGDTFAITIYHTPVPFVCVQALLSLQGTYGEQDSRFSEPRCLGKPVPCRVVGAVSFCQKSGRHCRLTSCSFITVTNCQPSNCLISSLAELPVSSNHSYAWTRRRAGHTTRLPYKPSYRLLTPSSWIGGRPNWFARMAIGSSMFYDLEFGNSTFHNFDN